MEEAQFNTWTPAQGPANSAAQGIPFPSGTDVLAGRSL